MLLVIQVQRRKWQKYSSIIFYVISKIYLNQAKQWEISKDSFVSASLQFLEGLTFYLFKYSFPVLTNKNIQKYIEAMLFRTIFSREKFFSLESFYSQYYK